MSALLLCVLHTLHYSQLVSIIVFCCLLCVSGLSRRPAFADELIHVPYDMISTLDASRSCSSTPFENPVADLQYRDVDTILNLGGGGGDL